MRHVINVHVEPAELTDDHVELAAALERLGMPAGEPEWTVTVVLVEDVDGNPAGVQTIREASLSHI